MPKKTIILNKGFASSSLIENKIQSFEIKQYEISLDKDPPKKRGRKPKSKFYFSQETEDAIVEYNNSKDYNFRNDLYERKIKYAFEKLAENIINTFKFEYIQESYEDIKAGVVSHMLFQMDKYDQPKGKAFSYFSIMAKNYLIILNNEAYARFKDTFSINQIETDDKQLEYDIEDMSYKNDNEDNDNAEFINLMTEYWDINISTIFRKTRDIEIAMAVNELFKNVRSIECFNKKALYVLIRQFTDHKTQYITKVINKMLNHYKKIKNDYLLHGYIKPDQKFF